MKIDTTTEFGARAARHLEDDRVVWLTTVSPDQTPQPSPVWFLWDGDSVVIYSQPGTPKLRNIGADPRVSLNFNCDAHGGDVVILTGNATADPGAQPANAVPPYIEKYAEGIQSISMTPEGFAQAYSVPIRITLTGCAVIDPGDQRSASSSEAKQRAEQQRQKQ